MPQRMPRGYKILRRFVRFWIHRFYTNIEIRGAEHIPDGPVIFAMNHPNNLIDSLMVGYAIERKINYLATSQIFRNRLTAFFLHNAGVIPIYRKQDDPDYGEKNVSTFQACYDILRQGGAIGIYPEGTTHAEPRVKKIKTGTARIALEAEMQFRSGVVIVPVGLNFAVRKSFRGHVLILIGKPIETSPYLLQYQKDNTEAVGALTAEIQRELEENVVHISEPDLDDLVQQIADVYKAELTRKDVDGFRLSQKLVEGIEFFSRTQPQRVLKIREEVRRYHLRLSRLRMDDELLRRFEQDPRLFRRVMIRTLLLLGGIAPALWGTIHHFLPYQFSRMISRKIAHRETDYASARIISGIILYSMFYSAQIYLTVRLFGTIPAILYAATLPVFGGFAYYYLEKYKDFRNDLRLLYVLLTHRRLLFRLKTKRSRIIAELDRAKNEYLNADLQA